MDKGYRVEMRQTYPDLLVRGSGTFNRIGTGWGPTIPGGFRFDYEVRNTLNSSFSNWRCSPNPHDRSCHKVLPTTND